MKLLFIKMLVLFLFKLFFYYIAYGYFQFRGVSFLFVFHWIVNISNGVYRENDENYKRLKNTRLILELFDKRKL